MKKKIKLFDPVVGIDEEKAIKKVLKSGFWASGAGVEKVGEFEERFKKFVGSNECVSVNSGTAALHLALSMANVENKEVLVPSLSFVSTANAIIYNNAKPVFVDIEPKTMCIDPKKIKEKITKNTRAILPVHFAGMPCNLEEILKICKQFNIKLIEDAAHASGTTFKNQKIGSHGNMVCFSFHPVKNLAMPTGGAITINDNNSKKLKEKLKSKRWCGITDRKGVFYDVKEIGWNYYMNEFSAAIGLSQLKKLDRMNRKRKEIAKRYSNEIKIEEKMPFDNNCSYHIYWILTKNRKKFIKKMGENNIETGIHYSPIHLMEFYRNKSRLPITEETGKNIVSIPIHPNLKQSEITKIISLTNKYA